MIYMRQFTQRRVPLGNFFDSTDGNTEETALTINASDIKLHKFDATSLTNAAAGAVHMANGVYYWTATSGDVDTLGPLVAFCHPSGALGTRVEMMVVPQNVYDALISGTAFLYTDSYRPDFTVSGSLLSVYTPADTLAYTKTVSTNPLADPIVGAS